MANTNITVTLTDTQTAKALEYARKVYPNATNAELRDELEAAAQYGPGIQSKIGEWEMVATRQEENANRQVKADEFVAVFPPKPDDTPAQLPED